MTINSEFRGAQTIIDRGVIKNILEWHYGSLVKTKDTYDNSIMYFIENETVESWFVNKETIGRYTGICDIKGNRFFEGDILLENADSLRPHIGVVQYDDELTAFIFHIGKTRKETLGSYSRTYSIVGNIYENPELLKR